MNLELRIKNFKKGFTLIELLVVIGIIGILSGLLMANFIGVRQRSRDGTRKANLSQIQSALEFYRSDQGKYPGYGSADGQFPNDCGNLFRSPTAPFVDYMKKIPCDPLGSGATYDGDVIDGDDLGDYFYEQTGGGTGYTLASCLENSKDNDPNNTSTSPGGGGTCPSTKYYVLHNP